MKSFEVEVILRKKREKKAEAARLNLPSRVTCRIAALEGGPGNLCQFINHPLTCCSVLLRAADLIRSRTHLAAKMPGMNRATDRQQYNPNDSVCAGQNPARAIIMLIDGKESTMCLNKSSTGSVSAWNARPLTHSETNDVKVQSATWKQNNDESSIASTHQIEGIESNCSKFRPSAKMVEPV